MRVAANRPATLRYHLVGDAGQALTPDNGTQVTVTITAGDGTTVLYQSQVATWNATDSAWEWTLPPQAQLDQLTAAWTATVSGATWTVTDHVDVIGERLVPMWQAATDTSLAGLSEESLILLADQVEEYIRGVLTYPPVLEGWRVTWDTLRGTLNDALYVSGTVNGLPYGWGAGKMLVPGVRLPAGVYSGSINGVAMDPVNDVAKLLVEAGCLIWADYRPWISGRYIMWGTHGLNPAPRDLRMAALAMMRHYGFDSPNNRYPDRAAQVTAEGATILFNLPGPDRPTGLPEVDSVLDRYRVEAVI